MKNNSKIYSIITNPYVISTFIFILLLIITVNRPMFCDEGLWHYIGQVWIKFDMPPYKTTVENKPPGMFLLYAISYSLFGVNFMAIRILGIIASIITLFILFKITSNISTKTAGVFTMYIFGLSSCWYFLDGHWPTASEIFMSLFITCSFYFLLVKYKCQKKISYLLLIGLFMGLAIYFKQIAIFTLPPLFFALYYISNKGNKIIGTIKSVSLVTVAIIITNLIGLIPLLISGVSLYDYFDGTWLILMNPGSSSTTIDRLYAFFNAWFESRIFIFAAIIPLLFLNKKLLKDKAFIIILIWFVFDFLAANASGNYSGHQIKQILPSISIIAGILISKIPFITSNTIAEFKTKTSLMILTIIIILLPYYNLTINGYFKGFPDYEKEIGLWIKENSNENDYVFVVSLAGSGPIMTYSERRSPSKYFNIIFCKPEKNKKILIDDINNNKPKFIVIRNNYDTKFNIPGDSILTQYTFLFTKGRYNIYQKKT